MNAVPLWRRASVRGSSHSPRRLTGAMDTARIRRRTSVRGSDKSKRWFVTGSGAAAVAAVMTIQGARGTALARPADPEHPEAVIAVNTTADAVDAQPGDGTCASPAGDCSLRAAVMEANALAGRDTVVLQPGSYLLTLVGQGGAGGDLDVTDDLELRGAGAVSTLVQAAQAGERVFFVERHPSSARAPQVLMDGISIRGGDASVGGAVYATAGTITFIRVEITGNQADLGGGVMVTDDAVLVMDSSTVSRNSARQGGGIFLGVPVQPSAVSHSLRNVTVSGNEAGVGGGIANSSNVAVRNSTITNNSAAGGAGVYNAEALSFVGSIIAGNTGPDCAGTPPVSLGHNLAGDGSCSLASVGDIPATDPLLEPIGDNGGGTETHIPAAASPALDLLPPGPDCPPADQRGIQRPQGPACDAGAVERIGVPVTPSTPTSSPTPTTGPTATGTSRPTNTATPSPSPTREPSPTAVTPATPTPGGPLVCPHLLGRVPQAAIDVALAGPERVFGWDTLCNPSVPGSPFNQRRRQLSLSNISLPYHPLYNGLVYRCGCP